MPTKKDTITVFREFLEAGKITPVIDRAYPLSEASEAIRYLMEGEPQGRVIINPDRVERRRVRLQPGSS
jgi:NADPH:quinone reductase-like Zn-dependent oxidoreductase